MGRHSLTGRTTILIVTTGVVLTLIYFIFRDKTPRLSQADFELGLRRWNEANISSYDLSLSVELERQPSRLFDVSVRNNVVSAFKMDGKEMALNDSYSVPGLFDILERELRMAKGDSTNERGIPEDALLRASFDAQYGFPRLFKRIAGDNKSCFIRVERFQISDE